MSCPDAPHHHSWFHFPVSLKRHLMEVGGSDYVVPYLKDGDSEGVSQVMMGGQQHFAVVSVQIHAGQQMQL